jgi:hypothetical protein
VSDKRHYVKYENRSNPAWIKGFREFIGKKGVVFGVIGTTYTYPPLPPLNFAAAREFFQYGVRTAVRLW